MTLPGSWSLRWKRALLGRSRNSPWGYSMRFSRRRMWQPVAGISLLVGLSALGWLGCDANLPDADDVFEDARLRAEANLLPPLQEESQTVFRNLLNTFAILPEICATPLAELGLFRSSLPTLRNVQPEVKFDDDDGDWALTWRGVILGDNNAQLTQDTATPRVDLRLIIRYRAETLAALLAVPFTLAPPSLQFAGEPPSYAAGTVEGFFLFQNALTGEWTLRWRALNTTKIFEGRISADSGVSRVIRRVVDGDQNTVSSLEVPSASTEILFEEGTAPTDEKGFTFFVRPGDRVTFRLQIGTSNDDLSGPSREQVRVGAADQLFSAGTDPGEFTLASSLPIDPVATEAQVNPVPGVDLGTFVWQEVPPNGCNAGEDQWRVRFSRQADSVKFTGTVRARDDDEATLRITPVGECPAGTLSDGSRLFEYSCRPADNTRVSGYDVCILSGNRPTFTPEINESQDSRFVFIGAARVFPPSPDPFDIRVDIELQELQSSQNLEISDTTILIRGNNDEDESVPLNPDQVSFDPLCRIVGSPEKPVQPRVRLIGDGDYSTTRFSANAFELDDVEFHEANVDSLADGRRFPDGGEARLLTRVEEEIENSEIIALMAEIFTTPAGVTQVPADIIINVQEVELPFLDQAVPLTVE
jgi:hypothetical protein